MADDNKSQSRNPLQGRAAAPGVWHLNGDRDVSGRSAGEDGRAETTEKVSDEQLMEIARMRLEQKSRLPEEDPGPPTATAEEESPIQSVQNRMMMLQSDVVAEEREHEEEVKERRYSLRFWGAIVALLLLGTGAIVGIVLGLGSGRKGVSTSTSIGPDEMDTSGDEGLVHMSKCATTDDTLSKRYQEFRSIILTEAPAIQDAIDAPMSAARVALCWLADSDTIGGLSTDTSGLIQRFVLSSIYVHFTNPDKDNDNDLADTNWLTKGVHECAWDDRLTCSFDNSTVTSIDLSRLHLDNSIPTELTLLTNLQYLSVEANDLTGTIPVLPQLQTLLLNGNALSGSLEFLKEMMELRHFTAGFNQLTGTIPNIGNLTNLEAFSLSNVLEIYGTLPTDLSKLTNLAELDLVNLSITGPLPPDLFKLTNLTDLTLAFLGMSGSIPSEIGSLSNLSILRFDSNTGIDGALPSEIGLLSNLKLLRLSDTRINSSLPTEIGRLRSLTELGLDRLHFLTGSIPSELGLISGLQSLSIGFATGMTSTVPVELCDLREQGEISKLVFPCTTSCSPTCCTSCTCREDAVVCSSCPSLSCFNF